MNRRSSSLLGVLLASWAIASPALAQQPEPQPEAETPGIEAPERVDIEPTAADGRIEARLVKILEATGWFEEPTVEVREGVVFLRGRARGADAKKWAGDLARNTQDVVAVVNQLELTRPAVWNFQPALDALNELWISIIATLPILAMSVLVLLIAYAAGHGARRSARALTTRRITSPLLRELAAAAAGVLVFLLGVYIALRVAGLTRLAVTVIGGTGLVGLIIGIAFREITENFLASVFLSLQRPFRAGDLVRIGEHLGIVQRLTTRSTLLMTEAGNHLQIPNATVYKATIENFSTNANRRESFVVGIGYEVAISEAQEAALAVVTGHPAVLKNPEPWVLVEELGSATVTLRVYFWLDGQKHSWLKVRSSLIRLVKRAFQERGISMPDEAREVVFPAGVPIELSVDGARQLQAITDRQAPGRAPAEKLPQAEPEHAVTAAEGGLESDAECIEEQARNARTPEEGSELLL